LWVEAPHFIRRSKAGSGVTQGDAFSGTCRADIDRWRALLLAKSPAHFGFDQQRNVCLERDGPASRASPQPSRTVPRMTNTPPSRPILIAGGGIGSTALALTLHQIACIAWFSSPRPNCSHWAWASSCSPNAVRELYDLRLDAEVRHTVGIQAREWALVGRAGCNV
jgi:hypothetical protein